MPKRLTHPYLLIPFTLLIIWGVLIFRLDEPFFAHREGGSIWIASAIRGFNQYGAEAYHFLPVRTPGPSTPETGEYYLHHPPLIVWFSWIGSALFGYDPATGMPHESSLRLVAIFFTLPTLPLIYVLGRRLIGARAAWIGFLLYSITPMTLYFGRMPYYDMIVLPFVLAFVAVFIPWMREATRTRTLILLLLAIVMMWVAWAGAFFLAPLGVVALIYGKRPQRIGILWIGVVTALATALIPLLYETLRPGSISDLINVFLYRTSNAELGPESQPFTLTEFVVRYVGDMLTAVGFAVTLVGAVGIIAVMRRPKTLEIATLLALIAAPFLFMAVFRNAFHFHDWYKIHFMPAFALCAALVIAVGWQLPPLGIRRFAKPLIVATLICSLGATIYWTALLHQSTYNLLARTVAQELPRYTAVDEPIFASFTRPYPEIGYYAYRSITEGILPATLIEWYEQQETVNAYYLLCDTAEAFSLDAPYESFAGCRLYHLQKG